MGFGFCVILFLLGRPSPSLTKVLNEVVFQWELYGNQRVVRETHPAMSSLQVDTLSNLLGCSAADLLGAVSVLVCSSGESYHGAVHHPIKIVISQLEHELFLSSMNKPQAIEKVANAIKQLSTILNNEHLSSSSTSRPSLLASLESVIDEDNLIASVNDMVSKYNSNAKLERENVQRVASMPQFSHQAMPQTSSNPLPESVLERPPLASQITSEINNDQSKSTRFNGNEGSRNARDTSSSSVLVSDNALKKVPSFDKPQDCALSSMAKSLCSPVEIQTVLQNLVVAVINAIVDVQDGRAMLLTNILQAPACSTPGVTGNELAWASLGSSVQSLFDVASTLLTVLQTSNHGKQNALDHVKSTRNNLPMADIFSDTSSLLEKSVGQFSSALTGVGNSNIKENFIKPKPTNNDKKKSGLFSFFGR